MMVASMKEKSKLKLGGAPVKQGAGKRISGGKKAEKSSYRKTHMVIEGIKKRYLKSRNACKVTFRLPKAAAEDAESVTVVGDFNDWNIGVHPMKKLKNGSYTLVLDLEPGKEYQFRYLLDGAKWENDWHADKYVRSPYGDSDNSVVIV